MRTLFLFLLIFSCMGISFGDYENDQVLYDKGEREDAIMLSHLALSRFGMPMDCRSFHLISLGHKDAGNSGFYNDYENLKNICNLLDEKKMSDAKELIHKMGLLEYAAFEERQTVYFYINKLLFLHGEIDKKYLENTFKMENYILQVNHYTFSHHAETYRILAEHYFLQGDIDKYVLNILNYSDTAGKYLLHSEFILRLKEIDMKPYKSIFEKKGYIEYYDFFSNISSLQAQINVNAPLKSSDIDSVEEYYLSHKESIDFLLRDYGTNFRFQKNFINVARNQKESSGINFFGFPTILTVLVIFFLFALVSYKRKKNEVSLSKKILN